MVEAMVMAMGITMDLRLARPALRPKAALMAQIIFKPMPNAMDNAIAKENHGQSQHHGHVYIQDCGLPW